VRRALEGFYTLGDHAGFVAGRVRLSGRIATGHAEGEWRGERATILDLYVPRMFALALPRLLGNAYGVPVETVSDLRGLGDAVGLGRNINDADRLELLYELRGWTKHRDELGRLVPPDGLTFGRVF
jgi:hypothetical protein